jgi:hypothetical protein
MPLLLIYITTAILSLLLAMTNGGALEVLGRVLIVFLAMPWVFSADYFQVREGTFLGLLFAVGGIATNSFLLWMLIRLSKRK